MASVVAERVSPAPIVVPTHVSQSSSRSNHWTRWSIAELKPSKTVKTNDWSSWPRSVRSQV